MRPVQGTAAKEMRPSASGMVGYAFFLVFGYMSFESPTALASLGEQATVAQSLFLSFALCGRIATYIVAIPLSRHMPRIYENPRFMATIAITVALFGFLLTKLSFELATYAPPERATPWLMLGSLLFGGGSAIAALMWAHVCSTFDIRGAYLFVLAGNLVSLAAYLVVTLLPSTAMFPLATTLLLISIACCSPCLKRRLKTKTSPWTSDTSHKALKTLWRPTLGTALLFFMSGLMLQMPHNQDLPLSQFQNTALVTQGVVVMALLLPILLARRQPRLESVFKIALPLSATGFLLLPLVWSGGSGIANACAQLGSGVADIILWCMLAGFVHTHRLSTIPLFACVLAATAAAKLAGTLVGIFFHSIFVQEGLALTAIALAALYLVAMMSMFLFKERHGDNDGIADTPEPPTVQASPDGGLADRCTQLAVAHGLTPRETELLAELVQGHTVRAIAKRLTVSENTVKYHIKGIYQKLGVHTRDEVIDAVAQD